MALNEVKVEMLSIITHISVQEMIDTYMVTFLPGIQTCPLGLTSGLKCNRPAAFHQIEGGGIWPNRGLWLSVPSRAAVFWPIRVCGIVPLWCEFF